MTDIIELYDSTELIDSFSYIEYFTICEHNGFRVKPLLLRPNYSYNYSHFNGHYMKKKSPEVLIFSHIFGILSKADGVVCST